jgi:hypothetical protein
VQSKHIDENNYRRDNPFCFRVNRFSSGFSSAIVHNIRGYHLENDRNPCRNDYQIVYLTKHGDEFWNKIDRTSSISDNQSHQELGIPRNAKIFESQIQRMNLCFQSFGSFLPRLLRHLQWSKGRRLFKKFDARAPSLEYCTLFLCAFLLEDYSINR